MTRFFLKMKHWQFFILTFGLPFLFQVIFMASIFASQNNVGVINIYFPILMFLYGGGLMGWLFSIGYKFNKLLPDEAKMKNGFFKFSMIFPFAYMILFSLGIGSLINSTMGDELNPALFAIIFPVHLFAMFCMFYGLYFSSKTLKTVESQRKIGFGDYAGEFFLMWFFPVGIWILQPRINKIFEDSFEKKNEADTVSNL